MFALRTAVRVPAALALVLCVGCASVAEPPAPVPLPAERAFEEARSLMRSAESGAGESVGADRTAASAAALEAARIAPDWIAPRRFLDDRAREDLALPEIVTEYRARLAEDPRRADLLYLVGRLEGPDGDARFDAAHRVDAGVAWVRHGLAWRAFGRGELRSAVRNGEAAVRRARDPFERSYFVSVLARYYYADDEPERAAHILEARLLRPDAAPHAAWLGAELAGLELGAESEVLQRRGLQRALELFARDDLTHAELRDLVVSAASLPATPGIGPEDLQLALMTGEDPYRRKLLGEWLSGERTRLALLASERSNTSEREEERAARFALGSAPAAVEDWLAGLPARVLNENGLPLDTRLARVVEGARAFGRDPQRLAAFGDALIAAGWFSEARALASGVPGGDLDLALDLERRGLAGTNLVRSLVTLALAMEAGAARFEPELGADSDEVARGGRPVHDLEDMLAAFAPALARARAQLGGEVDPARVGVELAATPIVRYGLLGSILHPGTRFSAEDQRLGRGVQGERVPGLPPVLSDIGRFGLFGKFVGGGPPDGTLLRALWIEERAGTHLGAPWSGTIAWCDGADLEGRASRAGASIAGAALHEGYWIDISVLRREREAWTRLAESFSGPHARERIARALAQTGLPVQRARDRASTSFPLGEAERVRLAILHERAGGADLVPITLDDLLEPTAIHEEGHLCDRARWYPPWENFGALFGFFLRAGFSPQRVTELLEYRAQLVALCASSDPRIPLVDLLEAAESSGPGLTPHASAYRELLGDLLVELDSQLVADAELWPELDPTRTLLQQLHHIGPERIRALGLVIAERTGLVE